MGGKLVSVGSFYGWAFIADASDRTNRAELTQFLARPLPVSVRAQGIEKSLALMK